MPGWPELGRVSVPGLSTVIVSRLLLSDWLTKVTAGALILTAWLLEPLTR